MLPQSLEQPAASTVPPTSRYISIEGSYVDTTYVDHKRSSYNDTFTYYTSYSSHQIYVPPPSK